MIFTIFTPTYNRAYLLPKLYESLKSQTFKDFEWLIVDDGSTDGTRDLIDGWIKESLLDIRYYYQENGGKHRAINKSVPLARGKWFFIVDSDDYLPDNSLEIANKWLKTVEEDDSFAGVSGMRRINGIVPKVDFEVLDLSPLRITEYIRVDKAEIFKTAILKKYPFPDIPGEKFCAEGLIWSRIGLRYKLRYFNEVIYFCEYLDEGLTKSSLMNRRKNPTYASIIYREQMRNMPALKEKIRAAINYWRFVWFSKLERRFLDVPCFAFFLLPVGILFCLRDNCVVK
jgi:glycosyltransferase involved in cell wall biosynthesis